MPVGQLVPLDEELAVLVFKLLQRYITDSHR